MATKYGQFSEVGHNCIGDPFVKKGPQDYRDQGLNFKAAVHHTGKTNDATFDKFKPVYEGEKYVDSSRQRLQEAAEKKSKNLVETPFRGPSPMKQSAGLGSYYHTFGGKVPYEIPSLEIKKKKGDIVSEPRGFYTSPSKRGTFGFNKTTLSERQGYKGVAGEFEYHADPTTLAKQKHIEQVEADRKARISELPFKPSHPARKGTFGVPNTTLSKGKGVANEYEYITEGPTPHIPPIPIDRPFRPSHPPKRGYNGAINRFPEYLHDPEAPKLQALVDMRKAEQAKLISGNAWKPSNSYKSDCVRSIIRMNI